MYCPQFLAHELIVLFGVYNLSDPYELGRIALSPIQTEVHPDWNSYDERRDADIAIMTFKSDEIPSSKFIQPMCLWEGDAPPTQTQGHVQGWGMNRKSGNKNEEIPTKLEIPIHTNEHCWYTEPGLLASSSLRTFCAGKADGRGICHGDSGGGVSIKVGSVFYFRGIVAATLVDQIGCDVTKFAIFTDVLKFKPWIDQVMSEQDELLVPEVDPAKLRCRVENFSWKFPLEDQGRHLLACNIIDQEIYGEGFSVAGCLHIGFQVFSIALNTDVKFLPENMVESFPLLIAYQVTNCSIKTVNVIHFKGLLKLELLSLAYNEIESIDGDSFKDLTKLSTLYLNHNKIKTIDPNSFRSLENLLQLIIAHNQIDFLDEKVFHKLTNLKFILLNYNKLSTVPANLFKNNLKLKGIKLSANKIQTISSTMFDHLTNLEYVDLQNNLCVNGSYNHGRFDEMKNALTTNCTLPVQVESLTDLKE